MSKCAVCDSPNASTYDPDRSIENMYCYDCLEELKEKDMYHPDKRYHLILQDGETGEFLWDYEEKVSGPEMWERGLEPDLPEKTRDVINGTEHKWTVWRIVSDVTDEMRKQKEKENEQYKRRD